MFPLLALQVIFISTSNCYANDLPTTLPRCYIDAPKIGDSITKAANDLRPYVRKGIKELGIPSYNPLELPHFNVTQNSRLLNISASIWDLTIRGMDNYNLADIKYDPKTLTYRGKLQFDSVLLNANYRLKAKALSIPVEGEGNARVALGPISGTFEIKGNMIKRKNLDYYNPTDVKIRLTIDDMRMHYDGLFDAARTNELLNLNSKVITKAATPLFETLSEELIIKYFKWLMRRYPYYELFPQSK